MSSYTNINSTTLTPAPTKPTQPGGDLRATADLIVDLAAKNKVQGLFHKHGEEPGHVYWLNDPYKGELRKVEVTTAPRDYQAMRLADVASLVTHFAGAAGDDASIFVACANGEIGVVLREAGDRLDRITMRLAHSAPYKLLRSLVERKGGEMMGHKQFVRMLQVDLSGCVEPQDLTTIRKLRFTGNSGGESTIAVGRESLGNSVNREATANGGDIPEYITLTMPVYEDLVGIDQQIRCVFDLDLQTSQMRLVPMPDEVVRARRITDEFIFNQLSPLEKLKGVRVFCGALGPDA